MFLHFRTKLAAFRIYEAKKSSIFRAPTAKSNNAIFRRFGLNLSVFHASAEGASEKFRVFYRGTAYDVIIFKF